MQYNVVLLLYITITYKSIKFVQKGVVGIDLAGDESRTNAEHPDEPAQVAAFQKAFDNGVHRTVHAAEAGPAWNAWEAVEILHAERIGHCYHCLESADIYTYVCLCERE